MVNSAVILNPVPSRQFGLVVCGTLRHYTHMFPVIHSEIVFSVPRVGNVNPDLHDLNVFCICDIDRVCFLRVYLAFASIMPYTESPPVPYDLQIVINVLLLLDISERNAHIVH